jgi:hypothetical protein
MQGNMPANMQRLLRDKDIIITTLMTKGPSLPIHLAKAADLSTLFASAYLSELLAEKRLKMSHMKVGSSSLYYLEGQEAQLENFIQYLNSKEREAFNLIKKNKVLEDEKLEPAIRVALRELKDFALPLKHPIEGQPKLLWKYYLLSEEDLPDLLHKIEKKQPKEKPHKEQTKLSPEQALVTPSQLISTAPPTITVNKQPESRIVVTASVEKPKKAPKKKAPIESKFANNIKEYLKTKDIEILSIIEEAKRDFLAKIRIDTLFGKQEYFLVARDKKKIKEDDLIHALHKAQEAKMPALLMAPGEIDKKSLDFSKDWRNLVKFEKVKF